MKTAAFLKTPTPSSVRLINFTKAEVRPGFLPKTWILIVSGTKPYVNMTVRLSPLIYVKRPEFWGIEVIGSLPGIGLPMTAPYTVSLPLDHTLGTKGIEVIGATRRKRIVVPPVSSTTAATKKTASKKSAAKKK
jgi:hypothetical protein